jgi:hypothetical protein
MRLITSTSRRILKRDAGGKDLESPAHDFKRQPGKTGNKGVIAKVMRLLELRGNN